MTSGLSSYIHPSSTVYLESGHGGSSSSRELDREWHWRQLKCHHESDSKIKSSVKWGVPYIRVHYISYVNQRNNGTSLSILFKAAQQHHLKVGHPVVLQLLKVCSDIPVHTRPLLGAAGQNVWFDTVFTLRSSLFCLSLKSNSAKQLRQKDRV